MAWLSNDAVRMALHAPLRNPGRSILTVLGLAIGVGAFVAMVSFGQGARSSVVTQFETLGTNMLRLRPSYGAQEAPKPITDGDVEALQRETTTLDIIAPSIKHQGTLVYRGRHYKGPVTGTSEGFTTLRNWKAAAGGMLDENDLAQRGKVCVLGATPAEALFPNEDPLGKRVNISGIMTCNVIGVLETLGQSIAGADLDNVTLIPLTTHKLHMGVPDGYSFVEVRPKSAALLTAAKAEVTQILRRAHHIAEDAPVDFDVVSPDEVVRVAEQVSGILTGLLAAIAGVSLLVGGVGIMNIQLVSVAERTHEIGIRSAIGASPGQIMSQFIAESVVLATLGSLAGAALGVAASVGVAWRLGWPHPTSPSVVIGSTLFGIAVGTLFGYIPARSAARLDPIQALRRE